MTDQIDNFLETFTGKLWDSTMLAKMIAGTGFDNIHVIESGMFTTADYRTDRIRVSLNEDGVVYRATVG